MAGRDETQGLSPALKAHLGSISLGNYSYRLEEIATVSIAFQWRCATMRWTKNSTFALACLKALKSSCDILWRYCIF